MPICCLFLSHYLRNVKMRKKFRNLVSTLGVLNVLNDQVSSQVSQQLHNLKIPCVRAQTRSILCARPRKKGGSISEVVEQVLY